MNLFLIFLLLFNVLKKDGDCLAEIFIKDLNTTEDAPYFRIFHGTPAKEKEFPYQVSMKLKTKYSLYSYFTFCGGTIIAPSKVLSAAHCFYDDKKSPCTSIKQQQRPLSGLFAVAGTLFNKEDKLEDDSKHHHQWRRIIRTVAPPDYTFPRRDITIVFISKPFIYNDYVGSIPYALEHKSYIGLECIASGYGQMETKVPADKLLWAKLKILSTSICSKWHKTNMKRFVCTLGAITDVGKGDSGGPLVCKKTGHPNEGNRGILVGVASGKRENRRKDGRTTKNAFFTRVSSFKQFIQKNKAQILVSDFTLWISAWAFSFATEVFFSD